MKRNFWKAMMAFAPLAMILPGWSLSEIPKFFWSADFKAFLVDVLTQVTIGVADAIIEVSTFYAFGLV
ncbi:MAG: hypothetical protein JSU68_11700 [Phycisphaerales bacterium]|nr:MAG: hypothetical protein JSU68_11700 [Phycisphaerales bacterium]